MLKEVDTFALTNAGCFLLLYPSPRRYPDPLPATAMTSLQCSLYAGFSALHLHFAAPLLITVKGITSCAHSVGLHTAPSLP